MLELSNERIEQILHEETAKKEEQATILRGIYTRYMILYEGYFADIAALNDDKISELRHFHEETKSLVKYYYMDLPQDVCAGIRLFDDNYSDILLGREWHKTLFSAYKDFREENEVKNRNEEYYKAEFSKQALSSFYDDMDVIFREAFGTGSQNEKTTISGLAELFFGKKDKEL